MTDLFADYSSRLQLEKLVIGLEEPILIKDGGEFLAKIDSGNGGYNVIHGENVVQQGDVITFKTYNKNGDIKHISKKLKEYVNVNIGSGNIEQRPVIELDVKFAGETYKKIPFSVANRTSNTHKVLICKNFVQNELDALIDVSGTNITANPVEVEYVTEAKNDNVSRWKKAFNQFGEVSRNFAGGRGFDTYKDSNKDDKKQKNTEIAKGYSQMANSDSKQIKEKLIATEEFKGLSENDIACFKLVDYFGKYYEGGDEVTKSEQKNFEAYKKIVDAANTPQKNESVITDGQLILEADNQAQPQQQQQTQATQQNQKEQQPQSQPQVQQNTQVDNSVSTIYKNRNQFFIYLAIAQKDILLKKAKYEKEFSKLLKRIKFPALVDRLFVNLDTNPVTSTNRAVLAFIQAIKNGMEKYTDFKGTFVFCSTTNGRRNIEILNKLSFSQEKTDKEKPKINSEDISADFDTLKNDWMNNIFLKNVSMDLNGNYEDINKLRILQSIANGKVEEDEEVIQESYLSYISQYCKRVYGNNIYIAEAIEEQSNDNALADVDFKAIAKNNPDIATEQAKSAINILISFGKLQQQYETLADEEKQLLDIKPYIPQQSEEQVSDNSEAVDVTNKEEFEQSKEELSPEEKQKR